MKMVLLAATVTSMALLATGVSAETLRYEVSTPALTLDPHATSDFTGSVKLLTDRRKEH